MIAEKEEIENYQDFRMKLLEAFHEKLIDRDEYDGMRKIHGNDREDKGIA